MDSPGRALRKERTCFATGGKAAGVGTRHSPGVPDCRVLGRETSPLGYMPGQCGGMVSPSPCTSTKHQCATTRAHRVSERQARLDCQAPCTKMTILKGL